MSIFRRQPRCPCCRQTDHTDPRYHQQQVDRLIDEARHLRKLLDNARCYESVGATIIVAEFTIRDLREHSKYIDPESQLLANDSVDRLKTAMRRWEHSAP